MGLTSYITTLLFNVARLDVIAFAGISAVMFTVALVASYLPALRASRGRLAVKLNRTPR